MRRQKGSDPCVNNQDCLHCNILTAGQKLHLSTPFYQILKKKERREQKSDKSDQSDKPERVGEDETIILVDTSLVPVIGVAKDSKKTQKSPEKAGNKGKDKKKHCTPVKCTKSLTDSKLESLDQKWFECFSRLEAFLISKSLEKPSQELTFQTVKMPAKTSPASELKFYKTFFVLTQPANQPCRPSSTW